MTAKPEIDEYITGDFTSQEFEKSFDFISAFLCLDYFDLDTVLSKVHDILEPGGVFCFIVNYWWWPVNSTWIVGDFPYTAQRLTRDDLQRYFESEYPSEAENVLKRYDYFHKGEHPTLGEYVKRAHKAGFSLAGARRLTPVNDTHSKTPVTPNFIERFDETYLQDVLTDIHHFNEEVSLIDLKTSYVMGALIKPKSRSSSLGERITERNQAGNYGVYSP
jgi:SAM-dependent methyltransferase